MRVFIYACESTYGGYHGIEDFTVEEFEDDEYEDLDEIYREWVVEMSYDLMERYSTIELNPENYESEDDFWYDYEEEKAMSVDGYVIKIKDDIDLTVSELNRKAVQMGPRYFREHYCDLKGE